jgi:uncharacterized protein
LPEATFGDLVLNQRLVELQAEIETGIGMCRESCAYYDLCLGGAPANKLAEHGSFAVTETMHCRLVSQAMNDVMLAALEDSLSQNSGPAGEYLAGRS